MAKILIVDDENNIRLMLRLALKADGHEVSTASDGPEALDLFGEGQFDLVLLDQRMPGMEGLEVLRIMKQRAPQAKIVMATAFGTVDLARTAMEAGANGFLRKPFTTEVLRAAVASALAGQVLETPTTAHFDAVSVNGFRLESTGDESSIERHRFKIQSPGATSTDCIVELPPFFIELVKAQTDREDLEKDTHFWRWLSEEALANYLWQNAAAPASGLLVVEELTSNLKRWMDATLAA
jgi:DNA-binding NtrC family response regulator